jgi:hypothetical protein
MHQFPLFFFARLCDDLHLTSRLPLPTRSVPLIGAYTVHTKERLKWQPPAKGPRVGTKGTKANHKRAQKI